MPINNVGYRNWDGATRGAFSRCIAIASTGIQITFKSQWIRRMLFLSWLPVAYVGIGFFLFEKYMDDQLRQTLQRMDSGAEVDVREFVEKMQRDHRPFQTEQRRRSSELSSALSMFPKSEVVIASIVADKPSVARHTTWCWMLLFFFQYTQGLLIIIMIGLIVPPLISRDLRSRAYLMYFSRPIGRIEYLLGKMAIPATFLAMITLLPAVSLYVFGVMLSPGFSVILDTWDVPFRVAIASSVLIIPLSLLALMFSALTHESRFAAFAWLAIWGLGEGAYRAITLAQFDPRTTPDGEPIVQRVVDWSFLSLFSTVGKVQTWVFGLETDPWEVIPFICILSGISIVAAFVLFRRISAPINA